jgi:hypothetical protein
MARNPGLFEIFFSQIAQNINKKNLFFIRSNAKRFSLNLEEQELFLFDQNIHRKRRY